MSNGNIVIGAGGHGKVIADIMLRRGMKVLGFLDDNSSIVGHQVLNLPILGLVKNWIDFNPDGLVAGIGDNTTRHALVQHIEKIASPPWITVIHPHAVVADSAEIGLGTVIMAGAIVNPDTKLGAHTIINTGATIDHDCVIGDFVHVAPGAHLAGGIQVGNETLLGVGCSVIPGCKIGKGCIIGAGAVVVCDIPSGVIAKGVPARWE